MFWRSSPGDNPRASIFRRIHERWLTRALASGKAYPRIPMRRVDQGGFDAVRSRPEARARADQWWERALERVDLGRLDHFDE